MLVRTALASLALLASVAGAVQAGPLDFLWPSDSGSPACSACPGGACGSCPLAGGASIGSAADCYGGRLPCCADARGCRDRWRMFFTKKCRRIHHQTFYPPAPPLFHPTWGYHPTCWRQFPPLPPCPPADAWLVPHAAPCELPLPISPPGPLGPPGPLEPGLMPPHPAPLPPASAPAAPEYDPRGETMTGTGVLRPDSAAEARVEFSDSVHNSNADTLQFPWPAVRPAPMRGSLLQPRR